MVGFIISFRPLSRYIGLYHGGVLPNTGEKEGFPSPLEVYRFISRKSKNDSSRNTAKFPSPLEVYRFISKLEWF